jgi:hypothetical protein
MHGKATVVQVDSLRRLGLSYWDGGDTGGKQNPNFFSFAAMPRV